MPRPTPFHPRTRELCTSLLYKEWAGCYAVCRYDTYHEREYYALRHAATVMDATPLYKYDLRGEGAAELLSRITVRDFTRTAVGRVSYVCWCNEEGKVLDDGTVTRLDDRHFRMTSAEPCFEWLIRNARGLALEARDVSRELAALALQGPKSREILEALVGPTIGDLRFFRATPAQIGALEILVTRTGYTGDLGYELWVENDDALPLWDSLMEAGRIHGLLPMGLDALDVSRVEAGFVLQGVDYFTARRALIERQTSTPYELNFDWMVQLEREPFVGQAALRNEKQRGPLRRLVGLDIDWEEFEALYGSFGLPPHLETMTCRLGVPVYKSGHQIGQATSRTWSPTLKRYLALSTVASEWAEPGTEIEIEVTVEYERRRAKATVTPTPFFDPERKKG
jgi:aminomethyltransferase